jgi:hypothetical protein
MKDLFMLLRLVRRNGRLTAKGKGRKARGIGSPVAQAGRQVARVSVGHPRKLKKGTASAKPATMICTAGKASGVGIPVKDLWKINMHRKSNKLLAIRLGPDDRFVVGLNDKLEWIAKQIKTLKRKRMRYKFSFDRTDCWDGYTRRNYPWTMFLGEAYHFRKVDSNNYDNILRIK